MALQQAAFNTATQNSPINSYNFRAQGSPYAALYADAIESILLAPDLNPEVVPSFPKQFTDLAYFMSRKKRAVKGLEYQRIEKPWIHVPLVVRANVVATAASAGDVVTQTLPITDGSWSYVSIGDKIVYPDGTNAIVTAKGGSAGSYTLTVSSLESDGIPAATANQEIRNHGPMYADGYSTLNSTAMPEYITHSNILENSVSRVARFDRLQKQELKNLGRVDMVADTIKDIYTAMMTAWQARTIMSQYGRTFMPDGVSTTTFTSGLLEQQSQAGVAVQSVTTAQALDAAREIIFDTALNTGGKKVALGTRRNLQAIGATQKADKVRYTPEDKRWNMDIYEYDFFGHSLVAVPCDQWSDRGLYGSQLENDILILNEDDIEVNYMEGIPMISRKHVLQNVDDDPSNLLNFNAVWYEGVFGFTLKRAWATGRLRLV